MKVMYYLGFVVGISMAFTSLSFGAPTFNPGDILRSQILKLVQSPSAKKLGYGQVVAQLKLYVNKSNEIIVLDTGTEHTYLDAFIKDRLNYRVIRAQDLKTGLYNFKITFVADQKK